MHAIHERLCANLGSVQARIDAAARSSGRSSDSIRLVAVTKQVDTTTAQALVGLGVTDLGESRPQELMRKHEALRGAIRWHLIGPLQRNKARRTLPLTCLIHSADRPDLLPWIERLALELGLEPEVLLEINISGEAAKHGLAADAAERLLGDAGRLERVRIRGLMTMAPYDPNPERARPVFAALRELRDRVRRHAPPRATLDELSMGMSGDFEVAIQEGATIVRIGSALFEGL